MKYSRKDLKGMSILLLGLKYVDDERYFQFVMVTAMRTNRSAPFIEQKIIEYANQ